MFPIICGIPKWMVKIMENPYENGGDLGVKKTPIFGNIHIVTLSLDLMKFRMVSSMVF